MTKESALVGETAELRPQVGVVVFPGSNDDRDAALALETLGAEPVQVWHQESDLPEVGAVVLPGGFSYGDYLRAGALASFSPAMTAVKEFAADGGPVLGICNGFQTLCEANLLPGTLQANLSLSFICQDVSLRVEQNDSQLLSECQLGQQLTIPIKHGDGRFFADDDLLAELEEGSQIALRYLEQNPNGSIDDIAAITNLEGNVMGLMPHPEHAVDPLIGSTDGAFILRGLIRAAYQHQYG